MKVLWYFLTVRLHHVVSQSLSCRLRIKTSIDSMHRRKKKKKLLKITEIQDVISRKILLGKSELYILKDHHEQEY